MLAIYAGDLRLTDLSIGPKTNQRTVTPLHPDMFQTSADRGRTAMATRPGMVSTFLPGVNAGKNMIMVHLYDMNGNLRPYTDVNGNLDSKVIQYNTNWIEALYIDTKHAHLSTVDPTEDKPLVEYI
jgi:hypothetical protein